jgi:hypothetical protein
VERHPARPHLFEEPSRRDFLRWVHSKPVFAEWFA